MKKINAVLCGYYGKGNAGDEALLASLLQMLPAQVNPIVLSANPSQTRQRYGVESGDRMSLSSVITALRQADAFIWGGGSLMQDATSVRNPIYYGGLMGLAQQMGLKTIAWAQGIGPLNRRLTRAITKRALSGCTAVSVRDHASEALLKAWGIPCHVAPDPVWALQGTAVKGLEDSAQPRVAIVLRSHPQLTPKRLENLIQAIIDFQTVTQTTILLLPFQPSQDLAIAQSIQPALTGASQILCIEDPRQLKGLFQNVKMVMGMRYHSLIMAAAEKCRCSAISYDPKVSQLMLELNLPGWDLTLLPAESQHITQAWLENYTNNNSLAIEQIQSLVNRSLLHKDLLAEVLLNN